MSLTIKAYLHNNWSQNPIETRRFTIDEGVATNYTYLTEKLAQIFPQVQAGNIKVSYLDADGDRITVSSDEEMTDALGQFDGTILRLYIKKTNATANSHPPPQLSIPPFLELASQYFSSPQFNPSAWCPKGNPPTTTDSDPKMETDSEKSSGEEPKTKDKTPKQNQQGPCHPGVVCDGCNGSIYGRRFKCTTCPDYDLCGECEGKGVHTNHNMYAIDRPHPHPWGGFGRGFGRPFNCGQGNVGGTLNFNMWGSPGTSRPFEWGPSCCSHRNATQEKKSNAENDETKSSVPGDLLFKDVLDQLKEMGFEDGNGLYELVKDKEGDIQSILDILKTNTTTPKEEV